MKLFELKDISYSYPGGIEALCGVSFDVHAGESLTIIGTNGSGKSTLLYLMNGLLKPLSGSVSISGEKSARGGLLFQNSQAQLFCLSVYDELCFGPLQMGLTDVEVKERAGAIMELLGISHLKDRGPWDLSGGEMKKVAIGTCLSVDPDVFLLDEPTSGLDPRSQVEIADIIIRLKDEGKTIVTATHDLHMIEDISERTIVIGEDHRVLCEGKPHDILDDHDMLLRANLVHKHPHRHEWYEHEHAHHGAHAHGVTDTLPPVHKGGATHPPSTHEAHPEIDRLKLLIEHWEEHNAGHAETYLEWAGKAEAMGRMELARLLREMAEKTSGLHDIFKKATRAL